MPEFKKRLPGFPAMVSAFFVGVFTHFYALSNLILNHDSMAVQPAGFGAGTSSGRWMLDVMDKLLGRFYLSYNLPYLEGFLFLLLLALAAGFLADAIGIRRTGSAALLGALFVSFPAVTSAMFFRFATAPYGLSILLAILAAWILPKHPLAIIPSVLCIAVSLGIYQAYLPFTISVFLLALLGQVLREEVNVPRLLRQGLYACLSLILGFALYYLLMKFFLQRWQTALVDYQGINEMGRLSLSGLLGAYTTLLNLPFQDYCSLANTPLLQLAYGIFFLSTPILAVISIWKIHKPLLRIFSLLLFLLLPLAINFIQVMCPDSDIYTLMAHPLVLLPILPLFFLEHLNFDDKKWRIRYLLPAILVIFCFLNAYMANTSYMALQLTNIQTDNFYTTLISQARMTPGYRKDKTWVIVGTISDPQMDFVWENVPGYGGRTSPKWLIQNTNWLHHYTGYDFPLADAPTIASYAALPQVQAMPEYPDYGSIAVIDDALVIKFPEK